MSSVPVYILKVAGDPSPYRKPGDIRFNDYYIASLLMPGAVCGEGRTPEEAKEALRTQMNEILKKDGVVEIQNDTLELRGATQGRMSETGRRLLARFRKAVEKVTEGR